MNAALMGGIFICAVRQTARNTKLADGNPVGYAPATNKADTSSTSSSSPIGPRSQFAHENLLYRLQAAD